ncbi:hypothetical protein [Capillimicrobium parvum]|uniref:Uncharacterized protein n=1 Tax=Capillimicrobium parvum TaxID=2884022 RepID=A0A9E7C0N6_9ACTN|nr:hypothetical protein [Capillimicrobium parvum]UGS36571.1 hypothetical protein DSM104329_02978 [Capillimicrobium parvum]
MRRRRGQDGRPVRSRKGDEIEMVVAAVALAFLAAVVTGVVLDGSLLVVLLVVGAVVVGFLLLMQVI